MRLKRELFHLYAAFWLIIAGLVLFVIGVEMFWTPIVAAAIVAIHHVFQALRDSEEWNF